MQFGSQLDGEVASEGWKLSIFNPLLSDLHVLDPIFNKGASRPDEFPGGKTQKLHFRAPGLAICLFSFFHYFVWPTKFVSSCQHLSQLVARAGQGDVDRALF